MNILSFETEFKKAIKPLASSIKAAEKELRELLYKAVAATKAGNNPEIESVLTASEQDITAALTQRYKKEIDNVLLSEQAAAYKTAKTKALLMIDSKIDKIEKEFENISTKERTIERLKAIYELTIELSKLNNEKAGLEAPELDVELTTLYKLTNKRL